MEDNNATHSWIEKLIHTIPWQDRRQVVQNISDASSPKFDFFLLVVLSSAIATLGLINDSSAVIIGAMLVAPLMSPIIGFGLATMTGKTLLLRNASASLLGGAILSISIAVIITLGNLYLPFVPSFIVDLPKEVLSRTQPTPNDLIIAMAGGIAAAYAMTRPKLSATLPGVAIATALMPPLCTVGIGIALGNWNVAGGALLLFLTNAVTIAFAASMVFFLTGFSPFHGRKEVKIPQSLTAAAILTGILLISLSLLSLRFFQQAQENRDINTIVESEVNALNGADLIDLSVIHSDVDTKMEITIRTNRALTHTQVSLLQQALVNRLDRPISLVVNQVLAQLLDPLNPPTPTPTVTIGPSPTPTNTFTPTTTATNTPTATPTKTATPLPTYTQLPGSGKIISTQIVPFYNLYQSPGGPIIAQLRQKQVLTVLYNSEIYQGLVWVEVMDADGRIGWIPQLYLIDVTPTPSE